jgi:hypothetical protein
MPAAVTDALETHTTELIRTQQVLETNQSRITGGRW